MTTVTNLIEGLRVIPLGAMIVDCNRGIFEFEYKGACLSLSLEILCHRTGTAEAYIHSAFVDAEAYAKGLR